MGLAMFLPMLEMVAENGQGASTEKMGNLAFILVSIENLGYQLNLKVVLITMFIFFALKGLFVWVEQYLGVVFRQYFIRKIRIESIGALAEYKYENFVRADAGRIQNTMSAEVSRVVAAYRAYSTMVQKLILVVTYTFLAFLSNAEFAGLVAIGGVLTNYLFQILYRRTKVLSRRLVLSNNGFQGLLIQQVAFFKYLKATGRIREFARNLNFKVFEIEETQRSIGMINSLMLAVREPLMIGIVVLVILVQVNWMGGSLGLIILSILFFYRALGAITHLQNQYNRFLEFSGSLSNLREFTDELQSGAENKGETRFPGFKNSIQLKNISFAYGDTPILRGLNFNLKRNETLALVGESGSGKTTLMNVLSGLLRPSSGVLLIDDVEFTKIDTTSFQQRIGYITQEPVIFDDTIFNNVTFWDNPTASNLERFKNALKQASIYDFVFDQPEQQDARLGNNGINLSGGQRQRISIARELYKEVDFLFMDEATSALDSETERAIQEGIDELKGKFTVLIIAHRLSTIKNADRVVVLSQGRVDHIGTYQELVDRSVSFRRMVELQGL